jgi:acetyltransferase-like isoleucine patch superfamily enzyme/SAM-dependent methyltransferase
MSAQLSELGLSSLIGLRDDELGGWYNREAGELATGFPVGADDVVLDVGCGTGGMAAFCAERGARMILVDADANNLAASSARLSQFPGLRLETHASDAHRLPLADGSVSRIVCAEVLEHVDNPAAVMAELVRVGRPGARYLITVPGTAQEMLQKRLAHPSYFEKPNHVRIFDPQTFAALVRDAGLRIDRTSSHGFFWSIWMALFWQTAVPLSNATSHPCLDSWARAWAEVLNGSQAAHVKGVLDEFLPKTQVIVASKARQAVIARDSDPTLYECTRHIAEGDRCGDAVMDRLADDIEQRMAQANIEPQQRPKMPQLSDLRIRREGLPDWWLKGNNVFLAAPGVRTPELHTGFFLQGPPRNALLIMGEGSSINHVNYAGEAPLICFGNRVDFKSAAISGVGYCTVLIGEDSGATMWAQIDARNGGVVSIGADGMWAIGVNLMTDDTHAVRDVATGKRLNRLGGKIIIGQHVWLGMEVQVLGDAYIGHDCVVGIGSLVRNVTLPPNTVSAGRPARVVREGVTWSRLDLP